MNIENEEKNYEVDKKTCCFTGHRPQSFHFKYNEEHEDCIKIKNMLSQAIEDALLNGYTHFISGMAIGVDTWAAEAVIELKHKYPYITLEAAIPCENQDSKWNPQAKKRYCALLKLCDEKIILQKGYSYDCMMKRNNYMVGKSGMVIAVYMGNCGGTKQTIDYAKSQNKDIVVISPFLKNDYV